MSAPGAAGRLARGGLIAAAAAATSAAAAAAQPAAAAAAAYAGQLSELEAYRTPWDAVTSPYHWGQTAGVPSGRLVFVRQGASGAVSLVLTGGHGTTMLVRGCRILAAAAPTPPQPTALQQQLPAAPSAAGFR